jgi:hypothetical protein
MTPPFFFTFATMKMHELQKLLKEVGPLIVVPKGEIDREHPKVKEFLAAHRKLTGKRVGEGNCKSCILDAYFELKSLTEEQLKFITMERKFKLKENALVLFNHAHYTNHNITDEVALEMVKFNRGHAKSFENGEELLAELDAPKAKTAAADATGKPKGKRGRPSKTQETPSVTEVESPATEVTPAAEEE